MPGTFETSALSNPKSLLNTDDFPELTGPTNKTLFLTSLFFLLRQPPTKRSNLPIKLSRSLKRESSKKFSPSSEKSISPSTRTRIKSISSAKPTTDLENSPDKESEDKKTSSPAELSITSTTASASFRLNLPFKKALLVNSPGGASSKPTLLKRSTNKDITPKPPCAYISKESSPV